MMEYDLENKLIVITTDNGKKQIIVRFWKFKFYKKVEQIGKKRTNYLGKRYDGLDVLITQ